MVTTHAGAHAQRQRASRGTPHRGALGAEGNFVAFVFSTLNDQLRDGVSNRDGGFTRLLEVRERGKFQSLALFFLLNRSVTSALVSVAHLFVRKQFAWQLLNLRR